MFVVKTQLNNMFAKSSVYWVTGHVSHTLVNSSMCDVSHGSLYVAWWVGCKIRYSKEGHGRGRRPLRLLLAVQNVTAHPSMTSVPITVLLYNGPLLCGFNVPIKGLNKNNVIMSPCRQSVMCCFWSTVCVTLFVIMQHMKTVSEWSGFGVSKWQHRVLRRRTEFDVPRSTCLISVTEKNDITTTK